MWPFKPRPEYTLDLIVDLSCGQVGKLQRHVERAVRYRKDRGWIDEWKCAEETLRSGRGDCEDFAVLYYTLLKKLGYEPRIVTGHPKRGVGHAICVFEIKGTWMYTTNWWLLFAHVKCKSALQCSQFAMRNMVLYREADTNGKTIEVL